MLKNYIKIAFRNLIRYRAYTFINIFGLAIGIICCLLILVYVQDELSYDRYHEKADQIYRIINAGTIRGNQIEMPRE
jgi:putative ABC transport system permease protein